MIFFGVSHEKAEIIPQVRVWKKNFVWSPSKAILKAGIWFSIKANTQITFKTSYDQENAGEKASWVNFVKKILKVWKDEMHLLSGGRKL